MNQRLGIRIFWLVVGLVAFAIGVLGYILPLLPGTVFMLIAAYAFARSSIRLSRWLNEHPRFGPAISNWNEHGAIARPAKIAAMITIVATPVVSLMLSVPHWILLVQLIVLTVVSIFILTRPNGPQS